MDKETLKKGNELMKKIRACKDALECFQYDSNPKNWVSMEAQEPPVWSSTNPKIIIEYDGGDGREQAELPFNLNDEFIQVIKDRINTELVKYQTEFNNL